MILYTENPKDSKKLLEIINKYSKFAGLKISIQRSAAFLCTNNELAERENKKTNLFSITTKRIKYLGINLTNEVKDLYTENYKTLFKEIEENTKKWKDIPRS